MSLRTGCSHRSVRGYVLEDWLLAQISQGYVAEDSVAQHRVMGWLQDHVVNLWHWDGHPTPPECQEQLVHICRGVDSTLNLSAQLIPNVFHWV